MATYDDVERLALTLPETTSASSYNAPALKVNNKLVARLRVESADQIDDRTGQPFGEVLMLKVADLGEKEALLATGPEVFFTTPHYDGYAAVLVRLAAISDAELQSCSPRPGCGSRQSERSRVMSPNTVHFRAPKEGCE